MNILYYLNPILRFGNKNYSYLFPLMTTTITAIILDVLYIVILKDPTAIGLPAIFLLIALIVYFAFRDGILGGVISVIVTVLFYLYLIYSFHYKGNQLISGLETVVILGAIDMILALVIGLLKQTIDTLIEREADGRRRLETIVEQLPVGVFITDNKGIVTLANKQAEKILGLRKQTESLTRTENLINTIYKDNFLSTPQTPLLQILQTKKPLVDKEFVLQRPDGRLVTIQVSATPVSGKTGKIIAAALILNDITQQKEMEQRKDDFINMASHELKTPLTTMKLYSDLLIRKLKTYDNQDKKIVKNVNLQIQRLQQIVNDLLDVSRLQTGKLNLFKEPFHLNELIEEICEDLQPSAKQKLKIVKTVDLSVVADKFRVYQVLTNLITNAMKYSLGTKNIFIRLEKKKNFAIVSVEDFGIGIAKSQQKKIFERLYQVKEAKGETYPGFGMGLYISKDIIQRHKGKIWVRSKMGQGTIFSFSLPLNGTRRF